MSKSEGIDLSLSLQHDASSDIQSNPIRPNCIYFQDFISTRWDSTAEIDPLHDILHPKTQNFTFPAIPNKVIK